MYKTPLEEMIDTAVDKLKFDDGTNVVYNADIRERWFLGKLDATEKIYTVRLDFEYPMGEKADDAMRDRLKADLLDLLVYGDVNVPCDHLLKIMDGTVKKGMQPEDFQIILSVTVEEIKAKKNTVEYTTYLRFYVRWPNV